MKIKSRGQLIDLINKKGVETTLVSIGKDKKELHTIIHCKKNNEFYRIVWGEIRGDGDVFHLWYENEMTKVKLNHETGKWMTKDEEREMINENERLVNATIDEMELYTMRDNLVFVNGINKDLDERVNKVQVVGGAAGAGKTLHVIKEVAKAIKEGKSILYFSTEKSAKEVIKLLIGVMAPEVYEKYVRGVPLTDEESEELNEITELISNSKLIIEDNNLVDNNYIIDRMEEVAESENGLDLVVIDHLKLSPGKHNHQAVVSIHEMMDMYRKKLGCKVIITAQLNKNYR